MKAILKPIGWQDCAQAHGEDCLTIRTANTPFGRYDINWLNGGVFFLSFAGKQLQTSADLTDLETFAQADFDRRVRRKSTYLPKPRKRRKLKKTVEPTAYERELAAIRARPKRRLTKRVIEPATCQEWPSVAELAAELGCAPTTLYIHLTTGAGQRTVYGRVFEYA